MSEEVIAEFTGITNAEAYVKIFSKRMMKPIPHRPGEFFGTDQRVDMLPFIQKYISNVPEKGQIFDVGAGAGDVVDFGLKDAPIGTVINIEEPNSSLIKSYVNKIKKYPNLKVGLVYEGPLQDYYEGKKEGIFPSQPQNLILAIHMIYHLTNFTNPHIDAESDLKEAISFLYGLLAQKGSLFIVYADLLDTSESEATCGMAEKFFKQKYPEKCFAENLKAIYQARNKLLGCNGSIADFLLQHHPGTKPKLQSIRKDSHFFGESIADIAVLGLATELCPSDNELFDIEKLLFCLNYVSNYPERINLQKELRDIPQKGLWRASEPQIIATITKEG